MPWQSECNGVDRAFQIKTVYRAAGNRHPGKRGVTYVSMLLNDTRPLSCRYSEPVIKDMIYCGEYCDPGPYASAFDGFWSFANQSGEPYISLPCLLERAPSALVTVMLSEGGESEMVRELNMPRISRRSSDTWSLGA